jgi:fatty acid desaturase
LAEVGGAAGGLLVPEIVLPKSVIRSDKLKLIVPVPAVFTVAPDASVVVVGGRIVVVGFVAVVAVVAVAAAVVVAGFAAFVVVGVVEKLGLVPLYPVHVFPNCALTALVSTSTFPRYEPL